MDALKNRIVDDLTGLLKGELRCDDVSSAIYATDASLYHLLPVGVAFPQDVEDVLTLAKYAAEQNLPLIPRGAGTNLCGGAIGTGLIVDFSRHMTRLIADDGETVRVEPGVVLERLNRHLAATGRYFPPDPATAAVTTLGGMISTNAAGSHSVSIGTTREHVNAIQVVSPGGATYTAGIEPRLLSATATADQADPAKRAIVDRLTPLIAENAALIEQKRPASRRNNCGYHVWDLLTDDQLRLSDLLVGSEGTLGLFTSATVRVSPLPVSRGVLLLLFGSMESAVEAVQALIALRPAACDLMDRRLLTLAREADPRFAELITPRAESALLVEFNSDRPAETNRRLREAVTAVTAVDRDAYVAARATTESEGPPLIEYLWTLPGKVVPRLTQLRGQTRPLPFVEDVAVPPAALGEFLVLAQRVFQKHQVTATLYSHAGDGQVHFRPFLLPPEGGGGAPMEGIARDLYHVALQLGGVVSGEHGDGLARTAFIRSQYGPLYRVFQQIKEVFDPQGLLNPGKVISDDPKATVRHLRPATPTPPVFVDLKLRWTPEQIAAEAMRCNGCGGCRVQEPSLRMCPFFRVDPHEHATPRAKANALRLATAGQITPESLSGDAMAELSALCFNCKQCERECPSQVNIPHLVLEAKAARVAAEGLSWSDHILSRTHAAGPFGSSLSFAANRLLASPWARWLMEKGFGLSRYRKVPRYARRAFLRSVPRRCRTLRTGPRGEKAVVYFVDQFANYHDPELGQALISVIERQGVPVFVPAGQVASGMALISAGDVEAARELAEQNLRILGPLAAEGHTIVCSEPAAALCLTKEYPAIIDHPDAAVVAAQTMEVGAFLAQLHAQGKFDRNLQPLAITAAYHTPCHIRAMTPEEPLRHLLQLIPELNLLPIEKGCSGMAGTWGLSAGNFKASLRMGWPLISAMRDPQLNCGVTECSGCRLQMEQGTPKPTIHPLKLLAASYAGKPVSLAPGKSRLVTT